MFFIHLTETVKKSREITISRVGRTFTWNVVIKEGKHERVRGNAVCFDLGVNIVVVVLYLIHNA